jgi:hypothetical protein
VNFGRAGILGFVGGLDSVGSVDLEAVFESVLESVRPVDLAEVLGSVEPVDLAELSDSVEPVYLARFLDPLEFVCLTGLLDSV